MWNWYLSGDQPAGVTALRHQIRDYLVRQLDDATLVDDADLVVQELVANAVEHALGPVWVNLSWLEDQPDLVVHDLGGVVYAGEAPATSRPPTHYLGSGVFHGLRGRSGRLRHRDPDEAPG